MQLDEHEVARTRLLTAPSRMLVLMHLGARRKVDFIRAGLGAGTIYYNLILLEKAGLVRKSGNEYRLTSKGRKLAEALYGFLLKAKEILGDTTLQE
ncbi:transcriptional regulator [Desulfurococcus mucosus]|uniref:Transcriptional regulator PadR family protein n=1 Tax=Desulfurococcus mucosus (strain ATCC 35584 / DSM 2162 / JCM 9187 / O7/1) TaxID=765177 RepID=E8RA84_DESM0|nr:transcriptional regulator [Desulfurococcus mucosus]ADV65390.1 transcriptional regulator PadR family protein [Desulfurococcus mucosus DSM 2162]